MAHVELDLRERRIIQKLSDQGVRVAEIALHVRRHRSTIYRNSSGTAAASRTSPS